MSPPSRSDLPAALVSELERIDEACDWDDAYRPVLPAPVTPPELVQAAEVLEGQLRFHGDTRAAVMIEHKLRSIIDSVRNGELLEPVKIGYDRVLDESDLRDHHRFASAYWRFVILLASEPPATGSSVLSRGERKRVAAQRNGVSLDLDPDDWTRL